MAGLTPKQARFVEEYPVDCNGTQAAIRAGYAKSGAEVQAHRLLTNVKIREEIDRRLASLTQEADFGAKEVIRELVNLATADPRELTEARRGACRFCYGRDHQYQETPAEHRERKRSYDLRLLVMSDKELIRAQSEGRLGFDEMGGVGYDPRKDPVEDCPECWGDGELRVIIKDTRKLSRAAARLYAGVKTTQNGIEVKTRDADGALGRLAQINGLLRPDYAPAGGEGHVGPLVFVGVNVQNKIGN